MRHIKYLISLTVSLAISLTLISSASATGINDSQVFLKQNSSSTCTLSSAAMMLRRRAILDGNSDWSSITETTLRPTAWVDGEGARYSYSFRGINVVTKSLANFSGDKKSYFISLLAIHPEGIVAYFHKNGVQTHAVLLTDYDSSSDVFYCADPSGGAPNGRIAFSRSTIKGEKQDEKINNINQLWYINSGKTISLPTEKSSESGNWLVTVPVNYKLLCYSSNTATSSNGKYVRPQSSAYQISCTKKAVLSNGAVRYYGTFNTNDHYWFVYTSDMTVSDGGSKPQTYTVTFDPNGGTVGQRTKSVTAGSVIGTMPTPTKDGYTFQYWSTRKDGGGMAIKTGNELLVVEDTTLYAIWSEQSGTPGGNAHTIRTEQLDLRSMNTTSNNQEGWSWNKETGTLVLNNVTIETDDLYALRMDSATIVLEGSNTIKSTYYDIKSGSASTGAKTTAGIYTFNGILTFEGTGSLTVTGGTSKGSSSGISTYDGQVVVNGGNITANGGESTVYSSAGISARNLKINGGTVTATGGHGSEKTHGGSYGVVVYNDFNMNGGTLRLSAGTVGAGAPANSLAAFYGGARCKINLGPNVSIAKPTGTIIGPLLSTGECPTFLTPQGRPVKELLIQNKSALALAEPSPKKSEETAVNGGYWGPWSDWSTNPISESSTREVETQTIKVLDAYTEYRYGRYIDGTGGHVGWCATYLANKGYNGITTQYSNWTTSRYGTSGKGWTCGACSGNHVGVDHYGSDGRAWWADYISPTSGSFFWEESRTVNAQYETQYRYRDWISG